ncbi:MAG: haloacid dehalogenase, partial [Acinetobacter sp.]|nr:haloacid dehalogenase [Acinetobacter sp.]
MIPKKAVIFDLDQTLLDRTTSLKRFLRWQINFFQLVATKDRESFIQHFLELDDNGKVWKDSVYQQLIHEFSIDHVTHDML